METITINRAALMAVTLFAAKTDVRYYLNGVLAEATPDKTRLVATDGHALACYTHAPERNMPNTGYASVIVPRELCARIKRDKSMPYVTLEVDGDALTLCDCGQRFTQNRIDGRFPDYTAVMPKPNAKIELADFNLDLLERLNKAAKLLGHAAYSGRIIPHGDNAALAWIDGEPGFVGCIMPIHSDTVGKDLCDVESARSHLPTAPVARIDSHRKAA